LNIERRRSATALKHSETIAESAEELARFQAAPAQIRAEPRDAA
jgi:hypothetical protein